MMTQSSLKETEFSPPDYFSDEGVLEMEEPEALKAPVKTHLRFGIDIDGTISRAPKHFKRLINALLDTGNLVYIVTSREPDSRQETEKFLYSMGIRYTKLIMKPVEWPDSIPDYKVAVTREKDLHILIDDEEPNCWAVEIKTRCLAAHMLPTPPLEEEFLR